MDINYLINSFLSLLCQHQPANLKMEELSMLFIDHNYPHALKALCEWQSKISWPFISPSTAYAQILYKKHQMLVGDLFGFFDENALVVHIEPYWQPTPSDETITSALFAFHIFSKESLSDKDENIYSKNGFQTRIQAEKAAFELAFQLLDHRLKV